MTNKQFLQTNTESINQFRALRNQFYLKMRQDQLQTILISGPADGVGKTTVATNLAASFASNGSKVLLIDANFSRPALADAFSLQAPGLAELLADEQSADMLLQASGTPNLDILTTGVIPEDASAIFVSSRFESLLADLKTRYDVIVFDGDTLLNRADIEALAALCDYTLLVVAHKTVSREAFADTQAAIAKLNGVDYGVVYNRAPAKRTDYDF